MKRTHPMMLTTLMVLYTSGSASAQVPLDAPPPRGQITAAVTCAADPSQSYAVYIPSTYVPDRAWPVILAFDPGGRGRVAVDRYQAAAEQYGVIVAGSNNSRNGSPDTGKAVSVMAADVLSRFTVDAKRVYTAGMSGGARVALGVALGSEAIAGVIASSAGYPDSKPRKRVAFPIFSTAGTEDFNHLEMRQLDGALTTPHHLAIFEGGHVWLSSELAVEAVEWMDLQAMKTGRRARDETAIDRALARRVAAARASRSDTDRFIALQSIGADFEGLRDVRVLSAEATALGREKRVRDALKQERDEDNRELRMLDDVRLLEAQLTSADTRREVLSGLRRRWKDLAEKAAKLEDSVERRLARRVLGGLSASVTTTDPDYLAIIGEYRTGRGRR